MDEKGQATLPIEKEQFLKARKACKASSVVIRPSAFIHLNVKDLGFSVIWSTKYSIHSDYFTNTFRISVPPGGAKVNNHFLVPIFIKIS